MNRKEFLARQTPRYLELDTQLRTTLRAKELLEKSYTKAIKDLDKLAKELDKQRLAEMR